MPIAVTRSITNDRQPRDLVRLESDASKSIVRKNSHPSKCRHRSDLYLQFEIIRVRAHISVSLGELTRK